MSALFSLKKAYFELCLFVYTYSNDDIGNISFSSKHFKSTDGLLIANNIRKLQWSKLFYPKIEHS